MESIENVNEYHGVWAGSIVTVMNLVANSKTDVEANRLMRFCIRFAYTQFQENQKPEATYEEILKEIEGLKLEERDTKDLTSLLAYYQAKAKMKSVQITEGKARIWARMRTRF